MVLALAGGACGGDESIDMPESEKDAVREAVVSFGEALVAGDNERACALTTRADACAELLFELEEYFIDQETFELALGEGWRERVRSAEVTFSDANHATLAPIMFDDQTPNDLVRQQGEWLVVFDEDTVVAEVEG